MKDEGRIFHDFRRSAARDMIRAGVPQRIAVDVTGHRTQSMFQRYNISDTDDLRETLLKTSLYRDEQQKKVRAVSGTGRETYYKITTLWFAVGSSS
jgi:integrase